MDRKDIKEGYMYHIKDSYFDKAADDKLMINKGGDKTRPALFCMIDEKNPDIMWFTPSTTDKRGTYKQRHDDIVQKTGKCDEIVIGETKGVSASKITFLPQNMFPVTDIYVDHVHTVSKNRLAPLEVTEKTVEETNNSVNALKHSKHKVKTDINRLSSQFSKEKEDIRFHSEYQAEKKGDSKKLLIKQDKVAYYVLGDEAKDVAKLLGVPLRQMSVGAEKSDVIDFVRLSSKYIDSNVEKLTNDGHDVIVSRADGKVKGFMAHDRDEREARLPEHDVPPDHDGQIMQLKINLDGTIGTEVVKELHLYQQKLDEKNVREKPSDRTTADTATITPRYNEVSQNMEKKDDKPKEEVAQNRGNMAERMAVDTSRLQNEATESEKNASPVIFVQAPTVVTAQKAPTSLNAIRNEHKENKQRKVAINEKANADIHKEKSKKNKTER